MYTKDWGWSAIKLQYFPPRLQCFVSGLFKTLIDGQKVSSYLSTFYLRKKGVVGRCSIFNNATSSCKNSANNKNTARPSVRPAKQGRRYLIQLQHRHAKNTSFFSILTRHSLNSSLLCIQSVQLKTDLPIRKLTTQQLPNIEIK